MTKLLTFRLSVVFAAVVGLTFAFVPLLAVHGVESALGMGLLLPPWIAATAASYTLRNRSTRGVDLMLGAMGAGLMIWAVPTAILAVNALRVRQCAPGEGLDVRGARRHQQMVEGAERHLLAEVPFQGQSHAGVGEMLDRFLEREAARMRQQADTAEDAVLDLAPRLLLGGERTQGAAFALDQEPDGGVHCLEELAFGAS